MSAEPVPLQPAPNTNLGTSSLSSEASSLPLWDRLSSWASENKAVVYTIASVAVIVSGAGVVYYLSDSKKGSQNVAAEEKRRLSKKERRKAKQEKEREKGQPEARAAPEQPKEQCKQDSLACEYLQYSSFFSTDESADSRVRPIGRCTRYRRVHCRDIIRAGSSYLLPGDLRT